MPGLLRRIRFENNGIKFTKRCDYCHRPKGELYQAKFEDGGILYMLCPGNCFLSAQKNFLEKSNKGILPSVSEDTDTFTNDIIEESRQGERNIVGEDV